MQFWGFVYYLAINSEFWDIVEWRIYIYCFLGVEEDHHDFVGKEEREREKERQREREKERQRERSVIILHRNFWSDNMPHLFKWIEKKMLSRSASSNVYILESEERVTTFRPHFVCLQFIVERTPPKKTTQLIPQPLLPSRGHVSSLIKAEMPLSCLLLALHLLRLIYQIHYP